MKPLISIVIPVYNQEQYILDCLDSIFPQCTDETEVVLVNDGSRDRSSELCRAYLDAHPAVSAKLIDQENCGSFRSRINGIREAGGEYIMFVDSDDLLLDAALETILQTLHEKRYDMILFNATRDLATQKPAFAVPLEPGQEMTGEDKYPVYRLLSGTDVLNNLWTKCFKKELFEQAKLPKCRERLTNGEDLYQILPLADLAQSIVYLDRVLYYYRVLDNSISRTYNPYYFTSEKIVCAKRIEYADKWSRERELVAGAEDQTYRIMREIARKVFIADLPWAEVKQEMQRFRSDLFFIKYYMESDVAADKRDLILKSPLWVMRIFKFVYELKASAKRK